ncbi:MAG: hypothetical protein J2P47_10190 [Acetobacteraceae bacterium]|nr:hypothetical protein [Acetobacteraceae bacterium]
MRITGLALLAGLLLSACTIGQGPVPQLPPGTFGILVDNDTGAINFAQWAFASSARIRGNPVNAARAAAAVDYLAVALEGARWISISPIARLQMRQARTEVRATLGIAQDAPTQPVIDGLIGAANALQAGDQNAARGLLVPPVFTFGPDATLARLSNMPFLRQANIATQRVALELRPSPCFGCR